MQAAHRVVHGESALSIRLVRWIDDMTLHLSGFDVENSALGTSQ